MYRETVGQRFGFCEPVDPNAKVIWVHSVSAGETIAAVPLVKLLVARGYTLVVTTMTPTGRERVRTMLGDSVRHFYAPYDMPDAILRFLRRVHPDVLVMIDTELWPNMIHYTERSGAKVILANGRLSQRSARRYGRFPMMTRPMLMSMSRVAVQTRTHGDRFIQLGLPPENLVVSGSIKFDLTLPADIDNRREQLVRKTTGRPVFVAASTHQGEETQVLSAFESARVSRPDLLLVLAPRHPHRCDEVQALCEAANHRVIRHSADQVVDSETSVLLLDTMGELLYFYALGDIAFIGGSLVPVGGHNLMEAACVGVPILMGPYLHNIDDIAALFIEGEGMRLVHGPNELAEEITRLCATPGEREKLVANASKIVADNRGALDRVERLIEDAIRAGGKG